jgi:hypothetical protein
VAGDAQAARGRVLRTTNSPLRRQRRVIGALVSRADSGNAENVHRPPHHCHGGLLALILHELLQPSNTNIPKPHITAMVLKKDRAFEGF